MREIINNVNNIHQIIKEDYSWFEYYALQQISSIEYHIQKSWINNIDLKEKSVNILNSGFGAFVVPLCLNAGAKSITLYDMDPLAHEIGYKIHGHLKGKVEYAIMDIVFDRKLIGLADVWVNTSCEHNYPTSDIIKGNSQVVLSGNNLVKRGHINPINSTNDLAEQYNILMINSEYQHIYLHQDKSYTQYTVIGNATPNIHDLY